MRDLLRLAAARGLSVHATHMPPGMLGALDSAAGRIWFDVGLTPCERRVVIAHELGHYYYGDECQNDRTDWRADYYAAALLVDPHEYARLERIDSDVDALADAFGVTPELIRDFQRYCLKSVGSRVYLKRPHARERHIA